MSLRVWLPLNGDLKNQGLDDITVTASGAATTYTTGKIGQAVSDSHNTFWAIANVNLGTDVSIACWAKSTSTVNQMVWVLESDASSILNLYIPSNSRYYYLNIGDGNNNPFQDDSGTSIAAITDDNLWHHLAVTFNSSVAKLYIDGAYAGKAKTYRNPTTTNKKIKLGGGYNNGHSYDWNGMLNDFRVYDHCLSPKEVKLLAQGLVCHYPLNNNGQGNWNLALDTHSTSESKTKTTTSAQVVYPVRTLTQTLLTSDTVTISFLYKANSSSATSITAYAGYPNGSSNSSGLTTVHSQTVSTEWQYYSWTTTLKNDCTLAWITAASGGGNNIIYEFKNFKVELGDKATPWCVAQSEAPDDIVYDTSGYCFNGTVKGTLTTSSDTPRYNVSTYFGSGNNYIDIGLANIRPKDAITVSMWIKYTTWGTTISCTESGGWNFENGTNGIRFPVYVSGVGYKYTDSDVKPAALSNGNWHLLTGTMDSTNIKFYIDGELKTTTAKGSTNGIGYNGSNHIHIGAEAAGGANITSATYVGNISDVRIYCTALSAEDVLELYNIGASIDNDGNLYAAMIQES